MKEKPKKSPAKSKKPNKKDKDYLLMAQRIQADFENYKKRSQKEKEEFANYANTGLILQILPILDNFRLATKHLPEDLENHNWAQGVLHIEKQLEQVMEAEGVEEIKSVGEKFDLSVHDAVEEVKSKEEKGIIIEEIQKGYKLKDKIIRHAKVKVSKGEK
jgi:molecular chaperone GrpE